MHDEIPIALELRNRYSYFQKKETFYLYPLVQIVIHIKGILDRYAGGREISCVFILFEYLFHKSLLGVRPVSCMADGQGRTWCGVCAGFRGWPCKDAIIGGYAYEMRSE